MLFHTSFCVTMADWRHCSLIVDCYVYLSLLLCLTLEIETRSETVANFVTSNNQSYLHSPFIHCHFLLLSSLIVIAFLPLTLISLHGSCFAILNNLLQMLNAQKLLFSIMFCVTMTNWRHFYLIVDCYMCLKSDTKNSFKAVTNFECNHG